MERIMLIYLLIIILFCVKSAELSTKSTTAMPLETTTTLTNTEIAVSSDVKSTTLSPTTFHSSTQIKRTGMSQNVQYSKHMTTTYTITNATKSVTSFSEPLTTMVSLSTVNNTNLSSEPTNMYSSSDRTSISTQSNNETGSVNSTVKLSTAYNGSGGLVIFSTTENTIGNSTFDQSTTRIGQSNKHSITSYQPTDTTLFHEARSEGVWNPFTDVHILTAASATTVIVVVLVIILLIIRKKKQAKFQSEENAKNGDYKSPTAGNNFKSYETPCDLDSSEYHIPSQVDNTYQTLDFTVRSHVPPKFAAENDYSIANIANINQKGDPFTKSKNAMFELRGIVDESDRNLQKTPLFYPSPSTKTIPSEETVAYCDTAIVHQEFLYDVPKHSIIDGGINPKNYFTGNQHAVAIIPSKEINQLKSTRILKDKTVNAMDSFKEKLNMSLSKKQFRQPNAYPVNPFPPSDTEIYSFAK